MNRLSVKLNEDVELIHIQLIRTRVGERTQSISIQPRHLCPLRTISVSAFTRRLHHEECFKPISIKCHLKLLTEIRHQTYLLVLQWYLTPVVI